MKNIDNRSTLLELLSAYSQENAFETLTKLGLYFFLGGSFIYYAILKFCLSKTDSLAYAALMALGYSKEMFHSGVVYYILHRPLNIIPVTWTVFTVFTVFVILARGRCFAFYKNHIGLSLGNFLLLNIVVLIGGFAPLFTEILAFSSVAIFALYFVGINLWKLLCFLIGRFNKSCDINPE